MTSTPKAGVSRLGSPVVRVVVEGCTFHEPDPREQAAGERASATDDEDIGLLDSCDVWICTADRRLYSLRVETHSHFWWAEFSFDARYEVELATRLPGEVPAYALMVNDYQWCDVILDVAFIDKDLLAGIVGWPADLLALALDPCDDPNGTYLELVEEWGSTAHVSESERTRR